MLFVEGVAVSHGMEMDGELTNTKRVLAQTQVENIFDLVDGKEPISWRRSCVHGVIGSITVCQPNVQTLDQTLEGHGQKRKGPKVKDVRPIPLLCDRSLLVVVPRIIT